MAIAWPDTQAMSDETRDSTTSPDDASRRRDHLRLVTEATVDSIGLAATAPRPRTIGRLIAQTALIADSAVTRRRAEPALPAGERGGMAGRLLGRFR